MSILNEQQIENFSKRLVLPRAKIRKSDSCNATLRSADCERFKSWWMALQHSEQNISLVLLMENSFVWSRESVRQEKMQCLASKIRSLLVISLVKIACKNKMFLMNCLSNPHWTTSTKRMKSKNSSLLKYLIFFGQKRNCLNATLETSEQTLNTSFQINISSGWISGAKWGYAVSSKNVLIVSTRVSNFILFENTIIITF